MGSLLNSDKSRLIERYISIHYYEGVMMECGGLRVLKRTVALSFLALVMVPGLGVMAASPAMAQISSADDDNGNLQSDLTVYPIGVDDAGFLGATATTVVSD